MRKKNVLLVLLVLLLVLVVVTVKVSPRSTARRDLVEKVLVGNKPVSVEIANTPSAREKGLSDRKSLCSDCGMLFVFDQQGVYLFWMRRMYFDIDIIWIAGDRVVDITYNAKAPSKEDFDQPKEIYQSQVPVDKVLEVNEGWVKKSGIKVGNEVKYQSKPL